jgi:hypothetical protein
MKTNLKKIGLYVLQVVLTALASAGIALLQSYLETHGVNAGPTLNPENTATIGGLVASGKVAVSHFRNSYLL